MYRVLVALVAVIFVVSCGKASPTSPLVGGATITGSIVGSAGSSSTSSGAAPSAGVVVSVVGGRASATVDANDHFTLSKVPPADKVDLRFAGMGLGSQVTLGAIGAAEHVSVTITRDGTSLALETIRHGDGEREELEGRVDGLPPTTAAGTFTVSGQTVQTDANTRFFKGDAAGTFADLALGVRVEVKGTPNATGILAGTVKIKNANADLDVKVEGLVADFSGDANTFQFTVNGRLVHGDQTTVFDDGATFASLVNGARVEVKGSIRDGFVFATTIEVEGPPTVEVKGLIAGFSGAPAGFQFTVNGQTVHGDQTTVFGDGATFASLVNGARVEVKGLVKDGFIFATKIGVER